MHYQQRHNGTRKLLSHRGQKNAKSNQERRDHPPVPPKIAHFYFSVPQWHNHARSRFFPKCFDCLGLTLVWNDAVISMVNAVNRNNCPSSCGKLGRRERGGGVEFFLEKGVNWEIRETLAAKGQLSFGSSDRMTSVCFFVLFKSRGGQENLHQFSPCGRQKVSDKIQKTSVECIGWLHGWVGEWTDEWMERWMDGLMHGWVDI